MRRLAAHVASNEIKLIFHAELRPKETNGSCGGKIGCLPSSAAQGGWVGAQRARTSTAAKAPRKDSAPPAARASRPVRATRQYTRVRRGSVGSVHLSATLTRAALASDARQATIGSCSPCSHARIS